MSLPDVVNGNLRGTAAYASEAIDEMHRRLKMLRAERLTLRIEVARLKAENEILWAHHNREASER